MNKLLQRESGMFAVLTAFIAGTTVIILIVSLLILGQSVQKLNSGDRNNDQARVVSTAGLDDALLYLNTHPTDGDILAYTSTNPRIGPGIASESPQGNSCYAMWFSNLQTAPRRATIHIASFSPIKVDSPTLTAACNWEAALDRGHFIWTVAQINYDIGLAFPEIIKDEYRAGHTQSNEKSDYQTLVKAAASNYWRFGTTDSATNEISALDGTYYNFNISDYKTPGPLAADEQALRFNGSSKYVLIPHNNTSIDLTNNFSLELWVQRLRTSSDADYLLAKNASYELRLENHGRITLQVLDNASGSLKTCTTTTSVEVGIWGHVVASVDNSIATIYLDGKALITCSSPNMGTARVNANPLYIGRSYASTTSLYTTGNIAEVAIYPRPLSAKEVKSHYEAR